MELDRPPDAHVQLTRDDYARAERFLPWNADPLVFNATVEPHWIAGSDRFWYRSSGPEGIEFRLIDPDAGTSEPAFDHVRVAAELSRSTGIARIHDNLPLVDLEVDTDSEAIRFAVDGRRWRFADGTLHPDIQESNSTITAEELASPDGAWAAFLRDHDLFIRSRTGSEERRLTHDGEPFNDYASLPESRETTVTDRLLERRSAPLALWSPDSRKLLTYRLNQQSVRECHLIQSVPLDGSVRPAHHSWRVPFPGDEHVPLASLVVFDVGSGDLTTIDSPPLFTLYLSPLQHGLVWWHTDSSRVFFIFEERGRHVVRLITADGTSGSARELIVERSSSNVALSPVPYMDPTVRTLTNGDIIWYSEADGWGHLYLHASDSGSLKCRLTNGAWSVDRIVHVDEAGGFVYFTAVGREAGVDPYLRCLYRVGLDGSNLTLLTPEVLDHAVKISPTGRFFVDTQSRADAVPVTVLRRIDGSIVQVLETADISRLLALGWSLPERFSVKGRDGSTDIYGVIVRPTHFDPTRKYPVVEDDYPGPQTTHAPRSFSGVEDKGWLWQDQALAELGFVVIRLDGQGTPFRSRAFLNVAYGRDFGEAGGLADHIAGLRQLAAERPYLDLDRVGMYGHSGGGFASARAILEFPDFYKVAVSSAGNHDNVGYTADWGERYVGMADGDNYERAENRRLASRLKGKLLLAYGEMDDNVHPALTLQLVDALIAENKDFDLLILPNHNHLFFDLRNGAKRYEEMGYTFGYSRYFVRRRWDYFVRHLLGAEPPESYAIA